MCFEVLELSVDIADWMDLYAEEMNENQSPLRQVYVEMERFYAVYETPTYRDVLELSLRPFAAQVFQSNGALHIRRLVSLSLVGDAVPYDLQELHHQRQSWREKIGG